MERLTCRLWLPDGVISTEFNEDFIFDMPDADFKGYSKMKLRLSEYEDTGLTPEDLKSVKASVMHCTGCRMMRREHGYLWCKLHERQVTEEDFCSWGTGGKNEN